jgi:hypothetical protein
MAIKPIKLYGTLSIAGVSFVIGMCFIYFSHKYNLFDNTQNMDGDFSGNVQDRILNGDYNTQIKKSNGTENLESIDFSGLGGNRRKRTKKNKKFNK